MTGDANSLRIRRLRVGFRTYEGWKQVLDLGHLDVRQGEAVGLVGESGSGKSVLALTIMRLLRTPPATIEADCLQLEGRELLNLAENEMRSLRGREVAMIFQDPMSALNPVFTVGSQLTNVIRRIHGASAADARARALQFITLVGLPDPESMLAKYPHQLSGGQRQRVIIALALCCDAKFLIADEPTRNLDVTVQAAILKTIAHLRADLGVSLLFIANNLALVSAMCDRVSILLDGGIVESGSVDEVIGDPRHPYTNMLLRVIPTRGESMATPLAGHGSAMAGLPTVVQRAELRCSYYDRCASRGPECESETLPVLANVGGTHEVACHREAVSVQ